MALEVETGSGLPNAESYASVADADAYHDRRGNTLWATMSTKEKEDALVRASDAMLKLFRTRWKGTRVNFNQGLDWPRAYVEQIDFTNPSQLAYEFINGSYYYPSNTVPREVVQACCEMAFKAAQGELISDLSQATLREKIGPIEVEYQQGSRAEVRYRSVEDLLAPFLVYGGASGSVKVLRA